MTNRKKHFQNTEMDMIWYDRKKAFGVFKLKGKFLNLVKTNKYKLKIKEQAGNTQT